MFEEQLIKDLKNGSRKAFDCIYKIYSKRLYAYCLQYCKSAEDAEEIVEDVFVRLWTQRKNIRQQETLKSLLFIMSKHLVINAYRKRVNSLEYAEYVEHQNILSDSDADSRIEYDEFVQNIMRMLKTLPKTQRQVIELSRFQGLGNKQIAAMLNLSEQTVKNQLSLGLKELHKKMEHISPMLTFLFLFN